VSLTNDIAGRTNEELKELLTPEGLLPHMNSFSNGWIVRSSFLIIFCVLTCADVGALLAYQPPPL
jgi:hypothetical protein